MAMGRTADGEERGKHMQQQTIEREDERSGPDAVTHLLQCWSQQAPPLRDVPPLLLTLGESQAVRVRCRAAGWAEIATLWSHVGSIIGSRSDE